MDNNEQKTRDVVIEFIREYRKKDMGESNTQWLCRQFAKYPDLWNSEEERQKDAEIIVQTVEDFDKNNAALNQHLATGKSHESYLLPRIEAAAVSSGVVNVGHYAANIDAALGKANQDMFDRVMTNNGTIDMNPQLKGNIMETDHANTFNIDAAANESTAHAEVKLSHDKNSVDLKVVRENGGRQYYQSKCSKTGEKAEEAFQNGNYRGQRKLVAKGQVDQVKNSTDHLSADGNKSKARTNEEYEKMQQEAQENGKIHEYDWSDANKIAITKAIGKKAALAGVLAVGFQGARILGRRTWNFIAGKENPSVEEDLREFVFCSVQAAGSAGLAVAATGGVTVAIKSGWLGKVLQGTSAGVIANAACIGIENIKILYKLGKGEISGVEALDQAGNATFSLTGGIAGATQGAIVGAALGTVLGPVGNAIGGVVGGIVGSIAGSTIGSAIYEGAKAAVAIVSNAVSATWEGIKSVSGILNPCSWF